MDATATESPAAAGPRNAEDDAALMARNGIARVRADQYLVDGYRYANLADALAQVSRCAGERADRS